MRRSGAMLVLFLLSAAAAWAGGSFDVQGGDGCSVYVDDRYVGVSPMITGWLDGGLHVVVLVDPVSGERRVTRDFLPPSRFVTRVIQAQDMLVEATPYVPPVVAPPWPYNYQAPGLWFYPRRWGYAVPFGARRHHHPGRSHGHPRHHHR